MQKPGLLGRTIVAISLAVAAVSTFAQTTRAQSLDEIRQAVMRCREAIKSLDVRVEFVEADPHKPETATEKVARVERFAFKGENRRFERWNHGPARELPRHEITLLGVRGQQSMTDGDFKTFGRRETCGEWSFSQSAYAHILRWSIPDPTTNDAVKRRILTHRDLEVVLRNPTYRVAQREGALVTLEGDPNPPCEALEAAGIEPPAEAQNVLDTIVLDAEKSFAVRSSRATTERRPDVFYEVRNADFREVAPGVWLPQRGQLEERDGGRHTLTRWRVVELKVNSVDDQIFEETLVPRSTFVDLDGPYCIETQGIPVERVWESAENLRRSGGPKEALR